MASAEVSRVSVRVVPDVSKFREELRRDLERATRDVRARVGIDVDTTGLRERLKAAVDAASRNLKASARVDVDRSAISRITDAFKSGPIKAVSGAFKLFSKSLAGLGAAGGAVQVIGGLASALSTLAPIALAAPGAILGIAAAYATLKVGMQGFGDALKSGDLSKLAPSARDAATAIRGFRTEWTDLQQSVQQKLFAGLGDDIRDLGGIYLPILKDGMGVVAESANLMGRNLANALKAPEVSNAIGLTFLNLGLAMDNARGALGNFVSGFIKLGGLGSTYLPALGTAIDNVAAKFNSWVDAGLADGSIRTFVDNAIRGFKDLGAIIGNIGSALGSAFSAISEGMGGASPLANLRELSQLLADTLASPAFQEALKALGQTMQVAGQAMREILGAALQAIAPILQAIMPLIQTFAQSLSAALVPAIETIGPPLARLVEALVNGLSPILPVLADLFVTLVEAIAPIVDALTPVVDQLGAVLLPVVRALAPIIGDIALQLGTVLADAITALAPILPPLVDAIGAILEAVLPILKPLLDLAGLILPLIADVVTSLVVPALEGIAWVVSNVIAPVIQFLADAISTAVQGVSDAISWVGDRISEGVAFITERGSDILSWFGELPGRILGAIGDFGSLLLSAGGDLIRGLWNGITGLAGWLKDKIFGFFGNLLPGWVKNILGIASPSKVFAGLGKFTTQGFAEGIRASTSDVFDAMGAMIDGATDIASGLDLNTQLAGIDGTFRSQSLADINHAVSAEGFGIDYDRLADAVASRPVSLDGKVISQAVRKDTRLRDWRR
ncbi:phage tail protein [Pseudonocardia sp. D17]|uniref:phage tail protein n=1 Tax=Pseudonocardia sp. D17 TaxID=882661 RepID=UPI002B3C1D3F|nr:hypothetical protein PSD17_66580 [Pseudonocardia sp. D17]